VKLRMSRSAALYKKRFVTLSTNSSVTLSLRDNVTLSMRRSVRLPSPAIDPQLRQVVAMVLPKLLCVRGFPSSSVTMYPDRSATTCLRRSVALYPSRSVAQFQHRNVTMFHVRWPGRTVSQFLSKSVTVSRTNSAGMCPDRFAVMSKRRLVEMCQRSSVGTFPGSSVRLYHRGFPDKIANRFLLYSVKM